MAKILNLKSPTSRGPITYTNRKGDIYYFKPVLTKTGKTTYSATRKPSIDNLQRIPPEFEIFENPADGIVTLRKKVKG